MANSVAFVVLALMMCCCALVSLWLFSPGLFGRTIIWFVAALCLALAIAAAVDGWLQHGGRTPGA